MTPDTTDEQLDVTVTFDSAEQRDFVANQIRYSAETIENAVDAFGAHELDEAGRTEEDAIELFHDLADQLQNGGQ